MGEALTLPVPVDAMIGRIRPTMSQADRDDERLWPAFHKLTLSGEHAGRMLELLERLGVNGSSTYPGLKGAVADARRALPRPGGTWSGRFDGRF